MLQRRRSVMVIIANRLSLHNQKLVPDQVVSQRPSRSLTDRPTDLPTLVIEEGDLATARTALGGQAWNVGPEREHGWTMLYDLPRTTEERWRLEFLTPGGRLRAPAGAYLAESVEPSQEEALMTLAGETPTIVLIHSSTGSADS